MTQDQINAALQNLEQIKRGEDPRDPIEKPDRPLPDPEPDPRPSPTDPLDRLQQYMDTLFVEYDWITDHLERDQVHCGIADWKRVRGRCVYSSKFTGRRRFGNRVPRSTYEVAPDNYVIIVSSDLIDRGMDWKDVTRHELAHALAYVIHEAPQKHNRNFGRVARRLDCDPSAHADTRRDTGDYILACPNGCFEKSFIRRSKRVKQPLRYTCKECGEAPVSYKRGEPMPDEPGTAAIR